MAAHYNNIKIFAANSHPALAAAIANELALPLGRSEVGKFSDGEINVSIFESVRGSDVFVVQSTCHPVNDNLMELLIMTDALKRASAGRITAVMPYFGYARQDRKAKSRDPISAKLVADLITAAGANRVLTMDLHAPQIQGFFNIPLDHLYGSLILAPYFLEKFRGREERIVVVSPDVGSVARARSFAYKCGASLAIIDKRRERANSSEVCNIIGDVAGKTAILFDDVIDTGGTICNAAAALIGMGGAVEVYACASHGVLSGEAVRRFRESPIMELVILDTIRVPEEKRFPKLTVLPVAKVFARAIERIYNEQPISSLFNE